jgi:hypothetical protein
MNKLYLEQLDVWSRKVKYYEYVLDENDRAMFGFINPSWGYGRISVNDDIKI